MKGSNTSPNHPLGASILNVSFMELIIEMHIPHNQQLSPRNVAVEIPRLVKKICSGSTQWDDGARRCENRPRILQPFRPHHSSPIIKVIGPKTLAKHLSYDGPHRRQNAIKIKIFVVCSNYPYSV